MNTFSREMQACSQAIRLLLSSTGQDTFGKREQPSDIDDPQKWAIHVCRLALSEEFSRLQLSQLQ